MTRTQRETRSHILSAAAEVFARQGYTQTTVADLAAAAGVTRPTVYAYFESKKEVFAALAERVRDDFLTLQHHEGSTIADTLRLTLLGYLDASVRHLDVLTVLAHQALVDPAMAALRTYIHDRANRRHARYIERLVAARRACPAVPPDVVAGIVTGITMSLAETIAADPSRRGELGEHLVATHARIIGLTKDDDASPQTE